MLFGAFCTVASVHLDFPSSTPSLNDGLALACARLKEPAGHESSAARPWPLRSVSDGGVMIVRLNIVRLNIIDGWIRLVAGFYNISACVSSPWSCC